MSKKLQVRKNPKWTLFLNLRLDPSVIIECTNKGEACSMVKSNKIGVKVEGYIVATLCFHKLNVDRGANSLGPNFCSQTKKL